MLKEFLQNILALRYEYRNIYRISIITIFGLKIKRKRIDMEKLYDEVMKLRAQCYCSNKLLNLFGSPSQLPPAKGILREKQNKILFVLQTIKRLCDENNFSYWLDCGTLLGAVRHKGFVPWDCDGDVSMLREDYLKLIPLLKQFFSDKKGYFVKEVGFWQSGKIGYHIVICSDSKDKSEYFCVDIFPFDKYYKQFSEEIDRRKLYLDVRKILRKFWKKCKRNKKFAYDFDKVRAELHKLTMQKVFHGKPSIEDRPALFSSLDYFWEDQYEYMIVDYNDVFPLKTIEFEGERFCCPNKIEKYLSFLFGKNYMQFPPKFNPLEDRIEEYLCELEEKI